MSVPTFEQPAAQSEEEKKRPTINERVVRLAEKMRTYDALDKQRELYLADQESLEQELEGDDLVCALQGRNENVAFRALKHLITQRNLEDTERRISAVDSPTDRLLKYIYGGKKLEIESLDPEEYTLGKFVDNGYGLLDGMGKGGAKKTGKIYDLSLNPRYGGYLQIKGSVWVYQAAPLIDRENDYQPAFRIVEL